MSEPHDAPPLDPRAEHLIRALDLQPHPEGGYYREIFRSPHRVSPRDGRLDRSALTTIHFLLTRGQHSRWHRVASDEVWHFLAGDPLQLCWIEGEEQARVVTLGESELDGPFVEVVPAGCWQAARTMGAFSLVGCTVGPGFEFEDFRFVKALPGHEEHFKDVLRAHEHLL